MASSDVHYFISKYNKEFPANYLYSQQNKMLALPESDQKFLFALDIKEKKQAFLMTPKLTERGPPTQQLVPEVKAQTFS